MKSRLMGLWLGWLVGLALGWLGLAGWAGLAGLAGLGLYVSINKTIAFHANHMLYPIKLMFSHKNAVLFQFS